MGRARLYPAKEAGYEALQAARKAGRRIRRTEFISIDGEGMDVDGEHRYVLLGCGDQQTENGGGLRFDEILAFLWQQFERKPDAAYCGFFLGYDFGQWFRATPQDIGESLFSERGRRVRARKRSRDNRQPFPVTHAGFAFDFLGSKRFKFRRIGSRSWMYICDTGSFFQASLLSVIDPSKWQDPIVSEEEYETIKTGKESRDTARLDDDMRRYNVLENHVLARLMQRLEEGFLEAGIRLRRDQWFGPGQAAQGWLDKLTGVPVARKPDRPVSPRPVRVPKPVLVLADTVPETFLDTAGLSYYGGWFEIFAHGIVPGQSFEYDINSAYPYIISRLPCLLHGKWHSGTGDGGYHTDGRYRIIHAGIKGSSRFAGSGLHRRGDGRIFRPQSTRGYYWQRETDAAIRAGLIDTADITEWREYEPCDCPPPLRGVRGLYDQRVRAGKNTSAGKAYKLVYNSMYGKFAQSIGYPKYANGIYASLITSGCREMILDAIASHPQGAAALVMVATDGVFFRTEHPNLPLGGEIGEWEQGTRENLTLFKPGVYWDDNARARMARGENPGFKARGISARQFGRHLENIDAVFRGWTAGHTDFPIVRYSTTFSMISPLQALQRGDWRLAGQVLHDVELTQSADPAGKRTGLWQDGDIWRSSPYPDAPEEESMPYNKDFGRGDRIDPEEFGYTPDGDVLSQWKEMLR